TNRRTVKLLGPFPSSTSALTCGASASATYVKVIGYEGKDAAKRPSTRRVKSCCSPTTRAADGFGRGPPGPAPGAPAGAAPAGGAGIGGGGGSCSSSSPLNPVAVTP